MSGKNLRRLMVNIKRRINMLDIKINNEQERQDLIKLQQELEGYVELLKNQPSTETKDTIKALESAVERIRDNIENE